MSAHMRAAEQRDLPAVLGLLADECMPTDGAADHLDSFVVAERNGVVVAAGGLELLGRLALLRSVVTARAHQAQGIASGICDRLEAMAAERGIERIYLLTPSAERWFARRGYRAVPREQAPPEIAGNAQFSELCPASAVLMLRESVVA